MACPHCSGRLTLVALIHALAVIARILTHLGLPVDVPPLDVARGALSESRRAMRPSRAPPLPFDGRDDQRFHGDD